MRACLLIVALLCSWLSMESQVEACSCLPPDKGRSYENADHVVHVRVQGPLGQTATTRSYLARLVDDDYKGCLRAGQRVVIETASSSAACGMTLQAGSAYLLHGDGVGTWLGSPRLRVGLCDANVLWSQLSDDHRAFLDSRYICCGRECGCADGSEPVNCFVDPCQVSSCGVEGAVCRSNYCGGCNAEWYDPSGALVCEADDACNYDDPDRSYVARSPDECAAISFICVDGYEPFFDDCGCGCARSGKGGACKVAGCSGQLCVEPEDPGITTCEWREEYACYRDAICDRQATGSCGWTVTSELKECLERTR